MVNQAQQTEKFEKSQHVEEHSPHAVELSRHALDVRVNLNDTVGNYNDSASSACSDAVLPTCTFEPLSSKEQSQAYVREVAAPLFEGSPPLMAYLDRSSYKGDNREFDGRVSVHNMNDFLKTYETMRETGQCAWPYTDKNAQYVRDLLDFKYPELTGENFAGFSARALCRRAGLTKVSVKHYDDYAVLATSWKQALAQDASFSRDAQVNGNQNLPNDCEVPTPPCAPVPEIPCKPVDAPPAVQPIDTTTVPEIPCKPVDAPPTAPHVDTTPVPHPVEAPCSPPAPEVPCAPSVVEAPCPPPSPEAPCAPPVAKSPCDVDTDLVRQHDREMRLRLEQMSTFENGGSYWRMANKFLHAGMRPCDTDDVTNRDINRLTRDFVKLNHSTIDSRGLPNPMVHPGDKVPVAQHLQELVARHDKLARAIERMMTAEQ